MKLSNFQAILLLNIVKDTLSIAGQWGGLYPEQRLDLYNQILQQQSSDLVDLDPPKKEQNGSKEV